MKSKHEEEAEQVETDVLVDDFKDLEIDIVASSRQKFLQWNRLEN